MREFGQKRFNDNQKVQETDKIKRDIWYHLTWQMMLAIIMSITYLPVLNKQPATRFICHNFEIKQ